MVWGSCGIVSKRPDLGVRQVLMMTAVLTNLGEKMSDEEVDELLKAVDTSSGELNYMGECIQSWKNCGIRR